jgi:hypothetical protein
MEGPLDGAGAVDLRASTTNTKKRRGRPPLGGAGAIDPRAGTINAKKRRPWTPWEVPEL